MRRIASVLLTMFLILPMASWGAEKLSKEELAAIVLLLSSSKGDYTVDSKYLDLDPSSPLLERLSTSDGLVSELFGTQLNDGTVTAFTELAISDNTETEAIRFTFNDAGEISRVNTYAGYFQFFYDNSGILNKILFQSSDGSTDTFYPGAALLSELSSLNSKQNTSPSSVLVASAQSSRTACQLDQLFDVREVTGSLTFQCSSGDAPATDYEMGGSKQATLRADVYAFKDGNYQRIWEEQSFLSYITTKRRHGVGQTARDDWDFWFQERIHGGWADAVVNNPNYMDTARSDFGYNYKLNIATPNKFPTWDEFAFCCNGSQELLNASKAKFGPNNAFATKQALLWMKSFQNQSASLPTCKLNSRPTVGAGLAAYCVADIADKASKYAENVTFAKTEGDVCAKWVYDSRAVEFNKLAGSSFYIRPTVSDNQDASWSANTSYVPLDFTSNTFNHFSLGGETPLLRPITIAVGKGTDPSTFELEYLQCKDGETLKIDDADAIEFQKSDQFYDQQYVWGCPAYNSSRPTPVKRVDSTLIHPHPSDGECSAYGETDEERRMERQRRSQHDNCADYQWEIFRNGQAVKSGTGKSIVLADVTQTIQAGNYSVKLIASNNAPRRTLLHSEVSNTDVQQCSFTVTADDEAIRQHMIGTWDVYDDFWVYSDGPYADGTRGSCTTRIDDVFVENYNVPSGVTADIYFTPYRSYRITLNENGSAILQYWNDSVDCGTKSEPDATTYSTSWQVQNGVFHFRSTYSVADIYGEILSLEEQFDGFEFFRKDHFYPNEYGSRYRLHRVPTP